MYPLFFTNDWSDQSYTNGCNLSAKWRTDGIVFVEESVMVDDNFTPLSISLYTDYACGFLIRIEESTGSLASVEVLSGPGTPSVNNALTIVSGLGQIGDSYQMRFTDDCGNEEIIDYDIEFLFEPHVESNTRCNLGGSCEELIIETIFFNQYELERPYSYNYIINEGLPSEVSIPGGQNIQSNDITTLSTDLLCGIDLNSIFTLRVNVTVSCGSVLTRMETLDRSVTMFSSSSECDGCITFNFPMATGAQAFVEFTSFPPGMTGLDNTLTGMASECTSQNSDRRNDYANYRVCADTPFLAGNYEFTIDDGCCIRESTGTIEDRPFEGTTQNIYSCGDGFTALQGMYSHVLSSVTVMSDPGIDMCIREDGDSEFPGIFQTGPLPLDDYTVTITDVCGNVFTENVTVEEIL